MTSYQQTSMLGSMTGQEELMASINALEQFQVRIRTMSGRENILDTSLQHLNSLWPFKISGFFLPNNLCEFTLSTSLDSSGAALLTQHVEQAIDSGSFGWVMKHVRPACFTTGNKNEQLIMGAMRTRQRVIGMFAAFIDLDPEYQRDVCAPFLAIYLSTVADAIHSEQLNQELQDHNRHLDDLVHQRTLQLEMAKEAAEVASRSKDMFLATISHELRTPLNAIFGFSQNLASGGTLSDKDASQVVAIHTAAEQLLSMINDLLDLALPDTNRIELAPGPVIIRALVQELCMAIQSKALEKQLSVHFVVAPEVPANLNADRKRLRQILFNLLENAVKFTDEGSVSLRVSRLGHMVRFSVEDSGHGISADRLPGIFRPFQYLESSLKRGEGGGLGLAISRNIAIAMGTEIKVSSEVEKGSIFWFDLEAPEMLEENKAYVIDVEGKFDEMLPLPPEMIQRFQKLVAQGDILALQEELESWMSKNGKNSPVTARFHEYVIGFRMKAIRQMLRMAE